MWLDVVGCGWMWLDVVGSLAISCDREFPVVLFGPVEHILQSERLPWTRQGLPKGFPTTPSQCLTTAFEFAGFSVGLPFSTNRGCWP